VTEVLNTGGLVTVASSNSQVLSSPLPLLFLLNSGIGLRILEANSPSTLSFWRSTIMLLGLLVPDRVPRPTIGDEGIILMTLMKDERLTIDFTLDYHCVAILESCLVVVLGFPMLLLVTWA
jgi:hypothetical protein